MDFTQYSVEDLREIIRNSSLDETIKEFGLEIKGKVNVARFIAKYNILENDISPSEEENSSLSINPDIGLVKPIKIESADVYAETPDYNSEDWEGYVLENMGEDGIDPNGYPLLIGLKRAANLLLGDIIFSGPAELRFDIKDENAYASCIYEVQIKWGKKNVKSYNDVEVKTFRAAADSWVGNTDNIYCKFPSAIAEARGEARALRKALNLKVVAKEELTEKLSIKPKDGIIAPQLAVIKSMSRSIKLKIDIAQYLFKKNLEYCSNDEAKQIIKKLNEFKSDLSKVPTELL